MCDVLAMNSFEMKLSRSVNRTVPEVCLEEQGHLGIGCKSQER